jgi:hypothetical protein
MNHVVKKLEEQKEIKVYFDFHVIEGVHGKLSWNKGKLIFKGKYEVILYHMIHFKQRFNTLSKRKFKQIPDSFKVSPNKIYW